MSYKYTIEDARREMRELKAEGYGFNGTRIFINDLYRGKDITKEEWQTLGRELLEMFDDCSFSTY